MFYVSHKHKMYRKIIWRRSFDISSIKWHCSSINAVNKVTETAALMIRQKRFLPICVAVLNGNAASIWNKKSNSLDAGFVTQIGCVRNQMLSKLSCVGFWSMPLFAHVLVQRPVVGLLSSYYMANLIQHCFYLHILSQNL